MDGETFPPGFITVIFSPRSARARYQYYHNFTFVIGWHRASVTCRAPFASPFSVSLSFFEPFILSSGCSLCPFLPSLSLSLSTTFSSSFLSFLPPSRTVSLLFIVLLFLPLPVPIQRLATPLPARSFLVFVRDSRYCSLNNCRARLRYPMTIGDR